MVKTILIFGGIKNDLWWHQMSRGGSQKEYENDAKQKKHLYPNNLS